MPIEIKELHIRVSITTPATAAPPGGRTPSRPGADPLRDRADLVAECLERVFEILRNKEER